jgi:rRNA-processing protein FCF1
MNLSFRKILFENTVKIPISQNRINNIVKAALGYIITPKVVASELEGLIMNSESNASLKLSCLYIIDTICKNTRVCYKFMIRNFL